MKLQIFCGGSSTTNVQSYTPTAQEVGLQQQALDYSKAVSPNALNLNNIAANQLANAYGTVQANYGTLTSDANNQIASGQNGIAGLTTGQLPAAYTNNMTNAIKDTVKNSLGSALATNASNGVINSSVMEKANDDIANDASNVTAQNYLNNISTLGNLYNNQIANAGQKITTTAAGQEASLDIPEKLWNMSLGLNSGGTTSALNALSGKGTTTQTSTTSGGGFGSLLGGLATGYASNSAGIFCFAAGTQVEGPYGFTPIEAVKVGDDVLAQDKDCCYIRDVADVLKGGRIAETVCLTTSLGDAVTTPTQPLMTPTGYVLVSDMKPGDDIYHYGRIVRVKAIEPAGKQRVYDLKVRKTNSYIANGFIAKGGTDEW